MQSNTARTFERSALIGRTPRELRRKAIKCFVADPAAAHLGSEGGEYLADGGSRVTSFERMARMYASCSRVMTLADASSTNQLEFYQYNFNATWISREVRWNNGGWPADVICPTLRLPICPFGLLNCGVFKKLNASARNFTRLF